MSSSMFNFETVNEEIEKINETYKVCRTQDFRKTICEYMSRIRNSLENTPDVVIQLTQFGVLRQEELERLKIMPSLWAQKQKLISLISQKHFEDMEKIIKVLGNTNNRGLATLLGYCREQILEDYPLDIIDHVPNRGTSKNLNHIEIEFDRMEMKTFGKKSSSCFSALLFRNKDINECPKRSSFLKLFRAASEGDVAFLTKLLNSPHAELQPCHECEKKTRGQTLLHAAVLANNASDVLECLEVLIDKLLINNEDSATTTTATNDGCNNKFIPDEEDTKYSLLNRQDEMGQTAIHLAAENERVKVVEKLYHEYNCDILIKNKFGQTALDLISLYMPIVTWDILNKETLLVAKNDDSLDGKFKLEIDFGRIIGCPLLHLSKNGTKNEAAGQYSEMQTLTKLVESNMDSSYILLSHVIVKTFVELKWKKMTPFIYSYMTFKVSIYIWYTLFVVHVFLAKCPISSKIQLSRPNGGFNSTTGILDKKTVFTYLFGGWECVVQALSGFYDNSEEAFEFKFDFDTSINPSKDEGDICNFKDDWQLRIFLVLGVLLLIKEICEAVMLNGVKERKQRHFMNYWGCWENRFQMLFNGLMILNGTLSFHKNIPNYYYSYAALNIIVVWALLFMQVGYLMGQGIYVLILGKIIARFGTLMLNYLCWIIAFSISLSILFPQEKPFETLPKSFLRVITMMSGELDYTDTFYNRENPNNCNCRNGKDDGEANGSNNNIMPNSLVFTAQIIYISLALLLTIILSNVLIGLVVNDVHDLKERSEVLLHSIKVDKMYTMEKMLLKLRWICPCLENIFVIQPKSIWNLKGDGMPTGYGMVLKISIKDIPKKLQQEIREFAMNPSIYKNNFKRQDLL